MILRLAEEKSDQDANDAHEAEDDADADDVATQNPAKYQKHDSQECEGLAREAHRIFSSTAYDTYRFPLE